MKLYITTGSPYARIVRIVIIEKRLEDRGDTVVAQTRLADSPYYNINPSGRVPYLVRDDGVGIEESALICRYLDHLEGRPEFDLPTGESGRPKTAAVGGRYRSASATASPESRSTPE